MKTIKAFYGIEPVLDVTTCLTEGPNMGVHYGLHRDRKPDRDWGELRKSRIENVKDVELTPKLKQILIEDIAYTYGNDSKKFSEKMNEFNLY